MTRSLGRYIVADTEICHGKPTFAGTRILVADVLEQVASFVRRFLRHPRFGTHIQRRGAVVRADHDKLHIWRLNVAAGEVVSWSDAAL